MDVDYIVGKRAEAESGRLSSSARKVRDGAGNHLVDLEVILDLRYPEGAGGDAARTALPIAMQRSSDGLSQSAGRYRSARRSWRLWPGHPSTPTTDDHGGHRHALPAPDERSCHPLPSRCVRCMTRHITACRGSTYLPRWVRVSGRAGGRVAFPGCAQGRCLGRPWLSRPSPSGVVGGRRERPLATSTDDSALRFPR